MYIYHHILFTNELESFERDEGRSVPGILCTNMEKESQEDEARERPSLLDFW